MIWEKFQRDSNSHLGFCIYANFCKHRYISSMPIEIKNELSSWIIHSVDFSRQSHAYLCPWVGQMMKHWFWGNNYVSKHECDNMIISVTLYLNMLWNLLSIGTVPFHPWKWWAPWLWIFCISSPLQWYIYQIISKIHWIKK